MRASEAVKLVFLQKLLTFYDKRVFLRLFDLTVLLCVIQVAVVQAQRKEEEEKKAAAEAEALNQEEGEQPQAMDTVDGSLHEDIPSNPSEVEFETFSIYLEVCIYVASNLMVSFVIFVADFYLTCNSFLNPWDVPVRFLVDECDSDYHNHEEHMACTLTDLS
jgi:hypothetical protein